ncbi:hypothetical protein GUITHDRAFT_155044 [Guillardia theta CCMP2712]|uniref:Uncharacterized protein n=1 Tax=Guillardia theta (strain CCMP2712) TaxID=905079 RepID=L1ILW7_GUITC|nr:hypothetical protein GUITHDRAFT_155044 [Guillardia theta CCMP2712]EKX37117.1 hypothetical protein GUITHDRAFT_155044 [Guillardia theta CCMP2712]|eukprot:XP_005824097.1 hypothetical protein GUITHDRAFT_155044 [Guillardia theta CCMP2712]
METASEYRSSYLEKCKHDRKVQRERAEVMKSINSQPPTIPAASKSRSRISRNLSLNLTNAIRAIGQLPTINTTESVQEGERSPSRQSTELQKEKSRQRVDILLQRRRSVERQKEAYETLKHSRELVRKKMDQSAKKRERPSSTDVIKYMDYPWDLTSMSSQNVQQFRSAGISRNPSPWQSDMYFLDQ